MEELAGDGEAAICQRGRGCSSLAPCSPGVRGPLPSVRDHRDHGHDDDDGEDDEAQTRGLASSVTCVRDTSCLQNAVAL